MAFRGIRTSTALDVSLAGVLTRFHKITCQPITNFLNQVIVAFDMIPYRCMCKREIPAVPGQPALSEEQDQAVQMLSPAQRKALMTEIEKAHRGMGHPNQQRFLRILKLGRATAAAIGLAKTFQCSQCKESSRPRPWRRSAPPRELAFKEVVRIETVTGKHYNHNIQCLNIVYWGTRYQMITPLQGSKAFDARVAYPQWVGTFGAPKFLKPDMGSEFLGDFLYRCATDGAEVDPASLESPTQNSITEREGSAFKAMYSKASLDYGPADDIHEICEFIDVVNMYKNRLCHKSGFFLQCQESLGIVPLFLETLQCMDLRKTT